MNALKKLLSVFLVACMALSVCAVSFAEGTEALPRVMAMKGPTAMGLSKLMTDEAASYDFSIASAIDEITPKLVKGEIDIAAVPANLGSRARCRCWPSTRWASSTWWKTANRPSIPLRICGAAPFIPAARAPPPNMP